MNRELRKRLTEVARTGDKFMSYHEAARILEIQADRLDHSHDLAAELDEISTYEHECGRPLLSVLVGHEDDLQPGGGFFKMAKRLGKQKPGEDDDEFYLEELRRTREYWQANTRDGTEDKIADSDETTQAGGTIAR